MQFDYIQAMDYAKEIVACTFAELDVLHLADQVTVEWNWRFTSRGADAHHGKKKIRLSAPLWPRASQKQIYEALVHEACHIASIEKHGKVGAGHGYHWARLMIKCGLQPKKYHTIDRTGLTRRLPRFPIKCGCTTHYVTQIKLRRIQEGRKYKCNLCGELIAA